MRRLSRHLPSPSEVRTTIGGWMIRIGLLAALVAGVIKFILWVWANPAPGFFFCMIILVGGWGVVIASKQWTGRINKLIEGREGDSICTFRRAFDLRRIDPWIVRATYQEFQDYFSGFGPNFPIRATDRLEADLDIDPEDLEDIVLNVAARAGYDLKNYETNPLWGKIETVGDFVMFFTHQPCRRLSA